jgi:hypothetical protein
VNAPTPIAAPPEHKRRKGRCVLLTVNARTGVPEYRGPFDSPWQAKDRGEELERAGEIGHDFWVFGLEQP